MNKGGKYHYYVEGDCEKKLISALKEQKNLIIAGKIDVINVVQERITELKLRTLPSDVTLILVFDTDTKETEILFENLKKLNNNNRIKKVICVMQVDNLEDEIVKSTNLKDVRDLFGCKSIEEFKRLFVKEKNLYKKLCEKNFKLDKIWSSKPPKDYKSINNDGDKIKQ